LRPGDRVRLTLKAGRITIARAPSSILAAYGVVAPIQRPEDFQALREEFEEWVADEVMGEL